MAVPASLPGRLLTPPGWLRGVLGIALPALAASAFRGFVFPREVAVLSRGGRRPQRRGGVWGGGAAGALGGGGSLGRLGGRLTGGAVARRPGGEPPGRPARGGVAAANPASGLDQAPVSPPGRVGQAASGHKELPRILADLHDRGGSARRL